jgi:beta-N-acetylhexosaminidase
VKVGNMENLVKRIGQLFIAGFPGVEVPEAFLNFLTEEQLGGVILFGDNCPTQSAARESIERIKACCRVSPPFVAIDQEGGRVSRLKGVPAEIKSAWHYGEVNQLEQFIEDYRRSAVFMESLGINVNLAPVADIFVDPKNTCLKDRCFGSEAGRVALFVRATVNVARAAGILSCLKHFPGLGAARNDPHRRTAEADYDIYEWRNREMIPFADGVSAGADMVMTTHVMLRNIDRVIVTGSKKIVNEMLRQLLAFDGPVITDDLTMEGAAALGGIGERAVAAFNAGHDLLLFGQDFEGAMEAYDYFIDAYSRGDVSSEQLTGALNRVTGIKYKLFRQVYR